ncbi:MAG: hypothetical protein P4L82_00160 [Ancalomicrobiaceae bacterium]|nr:hypothetical protein [Ancalomicrobiaceae bacterium]
MILRSILAAGLALAMTLPAAAMPLAYPVGAAPSIAVILAEATQCHRHEWVGPGGICEPYARGKRCPPGYRRGVWDGTGYRCSPLGRIPHTHKTF